MKLKSTATDNLPPATQAALDLAVLLRWYLKDIAMVCLKVPRDKLGPAGHFVQKTDFSISAEDFVINPRYGNMGIFVGFTMISKTRTREDECFFQALDAIVTHFVDLIKTTVAKGYYVELFVGEVVDKEVETRDHQLTRMPEMPDSVWIPGEAEPGPDTLPSKPWNNDNPL